MSANSIFQFLVPKDKKFFPLFEKDAANLLMMSEILVKLVKTENHTERSIFIRQIEELEHKGDEITHELFIELGSNFITPFDREDIHALASAIDDVADYILGASTRMDLYNITKFDDAVIKLTENIHSGAIEIQKAITGLKNMKNIPAVREACIRLNSLENEADKIFNIALANLFETEKDAVELIKQKELLSILETATDKAEDAANTIETIIIKYS
jgi:predicted phosphate transport protein (TIGR00153 family)